MFCLGLFNSNDVSMETIQNLKQKNFGGGNEENKNNKSNFGTRRPGVSPDQRSLVSRTNKKKLQFNNKKLNQIGFVLSMVVE